MISFLIVLSTTDTPGIGRIDRSSLSDQSCMELLMASVDDVSRLRDSDGDYFDACSWVGVICAENGSVVQIRFTEAGEARRRIPFLQVDPDEDCVGCGGSISMQWIPPNVTHFTCYRMRFEGKVTTAELPRGLVHLHISENLFRGDFSTKDLPECIESIQIDVNGMGGSLNMTALPHKLRLLDASYNQFSGTLHLHNLPESLQTIKLVGNSFGGKVFVSDSLPESLIEIVLNFNLCGYVFAVNGKVSKNLGNRVRFERM